MINFFRKLLVKSENGDVGIVTVFVLVVVAVLVIAVIPNLTNQPKDWLTSTLLVELGTRGYTAYADPVGNLTVTGTLTAGALDASVARSATYVVASSDSSSQVKMQADYVVVGNADDEIQAAINALTSGRVNIETIKLMGSFTIAAKITIPSYTCLDLTEARITLANAANCDMFENSDIALGNTQIQFIGGILDGNYTNQTFASTTISRGIHFVNISDFYIDTTIISTYHHGLHLNGCHTGVVNLIAKNIGWSGLAFTNGYDMKCHVEIDNAGVSSPPKAGVKVSGAQRITLTGYATGILGDGIAIHGDGTVDSKDIDIMGFNSTNNTYDGLSLNIATNNVTAVRVNGGTFSNNLESGIICWSSSNNIFDGVTVKNNGQNATCDYPQGVVFTGASGGSNGNLATNCQVYDDQLVRTQITGISEISGSNRNRIQGNYTYGSGGRGVSISGSYTVVDEHIMTTELDLSGASTNVTAYCVSSYAAIVGYTVTYTEASSADAGVNIYIGRYQSGVTPVYDYFEDVTSEVSKNLGYSKSYNTGDLLHTNISPGDVITVGTDGGKTGTGNVVITLKIVLLSGV